jgi:hypothetical protein
MNEDNRKYSAVRLTRFPSDIEFPELIRNRIYYDSTGLKLVFFGRMSKREKDLLLSLSSKGNYKSAVKELFLRSNNVKSKYDYWMRYKFAGEKQQTIQALVYFGAAILVIIVGLRGLGDLSNVTFIPPIMLNPDGKIQTNIVMVGLLFEFTMLCLLALISYYSSSEKEDDLSEAIAELTKVLKGIDNPVPRDISQTIVENVSRTVRLSENLILEEKKILNNYNNKVEILVSEGHRALENLSRKYSQIVESENRILSSLSENHVKPQVYMQKKLEIENQILSKLESLEQIQKKIGHQSLYESTNGRGFFKRLFG